MFNPYIAAPYIESSEALYGRADQLNQLRAYFRTRTNAVLFGPEGSGKSTLLRCFFNPAFCSKMAQKRTLIYHGEFPKNLDSESTYGYFADALRTSVEYLEVCGLADEMNAILRCLDALQCDTKQSRFNTYLNKITTFFKYRVVFVFDNFENFTSSSNIKPEHHDLLCGMLNDHKLQLIVATNYDFNETSLPAGTRNSQLLTRLSPHTIHMTPLSASTCQELLDFVAEDEDEDFRFTPQQVQTLHSISGGIPQLLLMSAKNAFDVLQEDAADFVQEVQDRTLRDAQDILKHWCKVTPAEQLDLLSTMAENTELSGDDQTVAVALRDRGLLRNSYFLTRDGRQLPADGYTYNSGLFRDFCHHREWLDEVLKNNPLIKNQAAAPATFLDPLSFLSNPTGNPIIPTGNPIIVQNMTVTNGDTYDHSVKNSVTYQPTVIADKGFARLFDILDMKGDLLGSKLLEIFDSTPMALPGVVDADTAAEETAERITSIFVPEEVEEDTLEECQEEQKTLEARFNAIRSQIDPEGLVTDTMLNSLSTKCRLYLQIAFVVDDALSALKDFHLGDLSAQMVMYGKVLEQQLKDNLYKLFHKDDVLRNIDLSSNMTDTWSRNTFACLKLHKTCIGNYMKLMSGQGPRLDALCASNSVRFEDQTLNAGWWEKLGSDVDEARVLRNGGDHAGTETTQSDLTKMRQLLFGEGRILQRCAAGSLLTQAIWPAQPKAVLPAADSGDMEALVGQVVSMTNIEVTARGSIRGTVAGTSHGVSISRNHLEERRCRPHTLLGKTIQVKLTKWDANPTAMKYNAELV